MSRSATWLLSWSAIGAIAALLAFAACTSDASVGSDARDGGDGETNDGVDARTGEAAVDAAAPDAADVDPSGAYSCLLRAGPNGCAFASYREGSVVPVQASIRRPEAGAGWVMRVEGLGAVNLGFLLGTNEIPGAVSGDRLEFRAIGTTTEVLGGCTVRYEIEILAQLRGDAIEGKVSYRRALPPDPQCASLACTTTQDLNGYRDVTADF